MTSSGLSCVSTFILLLKETVPLFPLLNSSFSLVPFRDFPLRKQMLCLKLTQLTGEKSISSERLSNTMQKSKV